MYDAEEPALYEKYLEGMTLKKKILTVCFFSVISGSIMVQNLSTTTTLPRPAFNRVKSVQEFLGIK